MASNNSINDDIKVATATSLNLGASTTLNGVINDTTFATASATTSATSSSTKTYIDAQLNVVQIVNSQSGAVASNAANITFDDSIPQIGEGAQYLTASITPTSATHKLLIQVVLNVSPATGGGVTVALFQDATANAIASTCMFVATAGIRSVPLQWAMTTGTTSSTTFTVRAGAESGTLTVNGVAAARKLGGVMISGITLIETVA